MKARIFRALGLLTLFGACYLAGATLAEICKDTTRQEVVSESVVLDSQDWGLGFSAEGQPPTGMATVEELKEYQTYYLGDTTQKRLYLTFDAGYENGNTEPILEALRKHQVKATFFCGRALSGNCQGINPEDGGRRTYGRKSYIPSL